MGQIRSEEMEMATEKAMAMAIGLIKRGIINPACLAFSHPYLLATASFVVVIYTYRPSLFGFLVSSSPVIVCAFVLFWIFLNFGKFGDVRQRCNVNRNLQPRRRRKMMDSSSCVGCSSKRMNMPMMFAAFDETSSSGSGDDPAVIDSILHTETTDGLLSESESETLSRQNVIKEAEAEAVMRWTADDEKNVQDVRTSELERNRKLEHLMSKRKSINRQRRSKDNGNDDGRKEKSLIDFDIDTSKQVSGIEEEEFNRILPVAFIIPRKNPFDSDVGEDDESNVPGSAPSVLIPRRNPFDVEVSDDNDHEFTIETAEFLRRNETFNFGVSISDRNRYERQIAKFRPYFVPERIGSDEMSYSGIHGQMSGITTETESIVSSVSDHSRSSSHTDPSTYSDDEIYGVVSRSTISSNTEDEEEEEAKDDNVIENSTSSVIIDSDTNVHHESVEPVYDSSPTEMITESEELIGADFYSDELISTPCVAVAAASNSRLSFLRNASKSEPSAVERGLLVPPSPPSNFADVERPIEIMPTIIEDDMDESRHDDDVNDEVISESTNIPSKNVTITPIYNFSIKQLKEKKYF